MPTNLVTVTIAGETLTAEDWPEGCPGFAFEECYDQANNWMLRIEHPHSRRWDIWQNYTGKEFQDRARCWFLDKAKAERLRPLTEFLISGKNDSIRAKEFNERRCAIERYLASAAKWARISKGLKT